MRTCRLLPLTFSLTLLLQALCCPSYAIEPCSSSPTTLCLADNRFRVEAMFGTPPQPAGAIILTEASGGFWFFDPNNVDVAVKILDVSPGDFWFFRGGLSDFEYTIKVTDMAVQPIRTQMYTNLRGDLTSGLFSTPSVSELNLADLVADFDSSVNGLSVNFTDLSTGQPDQWCWNFGDPPGSRCDSILKNPHYTYAKPGGYPVRLVVSHDEGPAQTISERTKTVTIASQPPPPNCTFILTFTNQPLGTKATNGQVTIKASAPSCSWTAAAASNAGFLKIRSGASGTGNGTVKYRISANPCCPRSGTLTIANQQVTVTQAGICSLNPIAASFRAEGDKNNQLSVIAPSGCPWTVSRGSDSDFLQITSSSTGSGRGDIFYDVKPNPAGERDGSLSLDSNAGPKLSVHQDAAPCKYTLGQRSEEVSNEAGNYTVSVNAPASCSAPSVLRSSDSFVSIDHVSSSSTGWTVSYTVEANTGQARRQDIQIADKTFTLIQRGCASFEPHKSLDSAAGSGSVIVSASPSCNWDVKNLSPSFLTVPSATGDCDNGTLSFCGNGSISYSVEKNPYSLARKGTLTIAGSDFIVEQAGCATMIEPQSDLEVPWDGGTRIIMVKAPATCSWIAESDVDFIDILGGIPGSGNGEVEYSVSSTSAPRDGSISIAGHTFKVHQNGDGTSAPGSCILSGEPDIKDFGSLGGISTLQVTAASSCSWTIGTGSAFVETPTRATTRGSSAVPFCVADNRHVQRSGFLAVSSGLNKTIIQTPIQQEAPDIGDPTACPSDDPHALCLQDGRFEVRVTFAFGDVPNFGDFFHPAGVGWSARVDESESTGYFSFSEGGDPELVVKILDGRGLTGSFWVYSGALTSRLYVITVTDTTTGRKTLFCNADGFFQSFADTATLTAEP